MVLSFLPGADVEVSGIRSYSFLGNFTGSSATERESAGGNVFPCYFSVTTHTFVQTFLLDKIIPRQTLEVKHD